MARLALLLGAAIVLVVSACGGGGGSGATFQNPVHAENFPDPFVLRVGDTYYAYGTNDEDGNVQTLRSSDLVSWEQGADAMPELGPWAYTGKTWAPEVLDAKNGTFVLYYTANAAEYGAQCIGRAVARSAAGPFVDRSKEPMICQKREGGSIDASPFRDDDGKLYLLWKNDGNCCGYDTYIYSQRLSDDGLRLVGRAVRLVKQDAGWEANLVEAPTLWKEDGRYYLFFSANVFDSDAYAVGYATCDTPLGPCKDSPENPILRSACAASGPGHQAIVRDEDGETWFLYHAWPAGAAGGEKRVLWLDPLEWEDGTPDVEGPTCDSQEAP